MRIPDSWKGPLLGLAVFVVVIAIGNNMKQSNLPGGVPEPFTPAFNQYLSEQVDRAMKEIEAEQITAGESFESIYDRAVDSWRDDPYWYSLTNGDPEPSDPLDPTDVEHLGAFATHSDSRSPTSLAIIAQFSSSSDAEEAFDTLQQWIALAKSVITDPATKLEAIDLAAGEKQWQIEHGATSPIDGLGLLAEGQRATPALQRAGSLIVVSELAVVERYYYDATHALHEVLQHLGATFVVRELGEWSYGAALNVICEQPGAEPMDVLMANAIGPNARSPLVRPLTADERWARQSWLVMNEVHSSAHALVFARSNDDPEKWLNGFENLEEGELHPEAARLIKELTPDGVHPAIQEHWESGQASTIGRNVDLPSAIGLAIASESTGTRTVELLPTIDGDDIMLIIRLYDAGEALQEAMDYLDELDCSRLLVKLADRDQDNI